MDLERAGLVICVTLFFVIGLNALIYLSVSRGNLTGSFDLVRRATQRVRDPWKPEEDDLKELSNLVAGLKEGNLELSNLDNNPEFDGESKET
jgi:hypothetical protein